MAGEPVSPTPQGRRVILFRPLRVPSFRLYWIAETVSRFGDEFQTIALSTAAIALTGNSQSLADILMVQNIPNVLLLLVGGIIVDRLGARRVMVTTNLLLGVLAAGLALVASGGTFSIVHLYIYAVITGCIRPFFEPASSTMLIDAVPREDLSAGSSLKRLALDISRIAAAPVAGSLVAGAGVAPAFAVNSASFLQASVLESRIRQAPPQRKDAAQAGAWKQVLEGFTAVRADVALWGTIVFVFIWYVGFQGTFAVGLAGLAQIILKAGPKGQGILLSAFGAGNLIGTMLAGNRRYFGTVGRVALFTGPTYAACFVAVVLAPGLLFCIPFLVVAGVMNAYGYVALQVLVASHAPRAVRGRILAVSALSAYGAYVFSYALAGAVARLYGPMGVLVVLGALVPAAASLFVFSTPAFRKCRIDVRT